MVMVTMTIEAAALFCVDIMESNYAEATTFNICVCI